MPWSVDTAVRRRHEFSEARTASEGEGEEEAEDDDDDDDDRGGEELRAAAGGIAAATRHAAKTTAAAAYSFRIIVVRMELRACDDHGARR